MQRILQPISLISGLALIITGMALGAWSERIAEREDFRRQLRADARPDLGAILPKSSETTEEHVIYEKPTSEAVRSWAEVSVAFGGLLILICLIVFWSTAIWRRTVEYFAYPNRMFPTLPHRIYFRITDTLYDSRATKKRHLERKIENITFLQEFKKEGHSNWEYFCKWWRVNRMWNMIANLIGTALGLSAYVGIYLVAGFKIFLLFVAGAVVVVFLFPDSL